MDVLVIGGTGTIASERDQNQARELCEYPHPKKPVFAGRNLYVALRDEILPDLMALNRALEPHLPRLFRLAARGHWMREHRPVRVRQVIPCWWYPFPRGRRAGFD
jgi:hypothetical protein